MGARRRGHAAADRARDLRLSRSGTAAPPGQKAAPLILWRVGNHAALDGIGGLLADGRWHSRGRRILYCSTSPAAALLETLVHLEVDPADVPTTYRLLRVSAPGATSRATIDAAALPRDWRDRPETSRALGDAWLRAGRAALLEVPSALVAATVNVLVNPLHPEARVLRVTAEFSSLLDPRLLR